MKIRISLVAYIIGLIIMCIIIGGIGYYYVSQNYSKEPKKNIVLKEENINEIQTEKSL